jgi:hypothetical protein
MTQALRDQDGEARLERSDQIETEDSWNVQVVEIPNQPRIGGEAKHPVATTTARARISSTEAELLSEYNLYNG